MTKSQILNTRATLQRVVANSTTPRAAKRAALLKLAELRRLEAKADARPAPGTPLMRERKTNDDARHFAITKYNFLCAQRGALTRRWGRLSRDEFQLHQALTANLPADAPAVLKPHDTPEPIHNKVWDDFVVTIKTTLAAVRDLPLQAH